MAIDSQRMELRVSREKIQKFEKHSSNKCELHTTAGTDEELRGSLVEVRTANFTTMAYIKSQ